MTCHRLAWFMMGCVLLGACDNGAVRQERVVVSAAASLTDAFAAIAVEFENANPGVEVVLNLGGSSSLREQILEGAAVDVFASADTDTMAVLEAAGLTAASPATFARNRMVIAVPEGNPGEVRGIRDLANPDLFVGLCGSGVPCGDFARQVLHNAAVVASVDSEEGDVRSLLTKVAAGELDVGIVYATDVHAATDVVAIELPADVNVAAEYPIVVLGDAPNPVEAASFVDFVLSPSGQALLADFGFVTA